MNLAIHAALPDATRDQLGVLRTEIENQDSVRVDVGMQAGAGADCAFKRGPRKTGSGL